MAKRPLKYIAIDELAPASRNPQGHSLPKLRESFDRFGFTVPILLCTRRNEVAAGNGRLELLAQMQAEGAVPPEGVDVRAGKYLAPVLLWESADDEEFDAYVIADNEQERLGQRDERLMADMLEGLRERSSLLGTGFDEDRLAKLRARFNPTPPTEFKTVSPGSVRVEYECPQCGFSWAGRPRQSDGN